MTGLVYPFCQCSHFIDRELFTAYGWFPSCDYIICSISVQPTQLPVKIFSVQCSFWAKYEKKSSIQMHRLYLTCMLQTNSPLILVGPDGASEPLSLLYSQKCWINSKPFQLWPPNFETFPKNYLGTFKFVVTCTSKLRLTLEPSL